MCIIVIVYIGYFIPQKLALTDKTYSKFIPDSKGPHSNLRSKMNRHYRKYVHSTCSKQKH